MALVAPHPSDFGKPPGLEAFRPQIPLLGGNGHALTAAAVNGLSEGAVDDDNAVLAPHTKVVVVGNNRTKQSLVGERGVIKRAVGLGGWHLLVRLGVLLMVSG